MTDVLFPFAKWALGLVLPIIGSRIGGRRAGRKRKRAFRECERLMPDVFMVLRNGLQNSPCARVFLSCTSSSGTYILFANQHTSGTDWREKLELLESEGFIERIVQHQYRIHDEFGKMLLC